MTDGGTAIIRFAGAYDFLSNFYYAPVTYGGITYPTNEHAFQAAKTDDYLERVHIAGLATPGASKAAGRRVQLRDDWEFVKDDVMADLLRLKFPDDPKNDLTQRLVSTWPAKLYEANTWGDKIWGTDLQLNGENRLGKLLEQRREELIKAHGYRIGIPGAVHPASDPVS